MSVFDVLIEIRLATAEAHEFQAKSYRARARAHRLDGEVAAAKRYEGFANDYEEMAKRYTRMGESLKAMEIGE